MKKGETDSATRFSSLRLRAAASAGLLALLLCACTPVDSDLFHIVNRSREPIEVMWKRYPQPFTTVSPNSAARFYVSDGACASPQPDAGLVARAETGKTYTYGPPVCRGKTWTIHE